MRGVRRSALAIDRMVAGGVSVKRWRTIRVCRVSSGTRLAIGGNSRTADEEG
jgi:hypothetical protein